MHYKPKYRIIKLEEDIIQRDIFLTTDLRIFEHDYILSIFAYLPQSLEA